MYKSLNSKYPSVTKLLIIIQFGCFWVALSSCFQYTESSIANESDNRTAKPPQSTIVSVTVTPEENQYEALIQQIGQITDCFPPCLWGVTPGITTTTEFMKEFQQFGDISEYKMNSGDVEHIFFIKETYNSDIYNDPIEVRIIASDSIITEIWISGKIVEPKLSNIAEILSSWGQPSEIWVEIIPESFAFTGEYKMLLVYDDHHASVMLLSDMEEQDNQYVICPQLLSGFTASGPTLHFWSIFESNGLFEIETKEKFSPLSRVNAQYSIEYFMESFSDPTRKKCIDTGIAISE